MKKVISIFKDAVFSVSSGEVIPIGCKYPVAKYDFIAYLDELINMNVEKSKECIMIVNDYSFVVEFTDTGNRVMFMNVIHPRYIDVAKYLLSENFTVKIKDNTKRKNKT